MTIEEFLRGVSRYPVPTETLKGIAEKRGIDLAGESLSAIGTAPLDLAGADLLTWLSEAPDISQGGQNYSFDSETRKMMKARARGIYIERGEAEAEEAPKPTYGYKGERL